MNGFLNINKPKGISSYDVIRKLKKYLKKKTKIGHLGTLDPMAEGVLPIAIGQATKLIHLLEDGKKVYQAKMILGGISDTQDAWGNIEPTGNVDLLISNSLNQEKLLNIIENFKGEIEQIPPMFSAVHHEGQRLYDLARKGITVERKSRITNIYKLDILNIGHDENKKPLIELLIECSRGTYIRTICHDIGLALGTGAYMSELNRLQSAYFHIDNTVDLESIDQDNISSHLIDMDFPFKHYDSFIVNESEKIKILHGNPIVKNDKLHSSIVRLYSQNQELLAIAKGMQEGNEIIIKPYKVFHIEEE